MPKKFPQNKHCDKGGIKCRKVGDYKVGGGGSLGEMTGMALRWRHSMANKTK